MNRKKIIGLALGWVAASFVLGGVIASAASATETPTTAPNVGVGPPPQASASGCGVEIDPDPGTTVLVFNVKVDGVANDFTARDTHAPIAHFSFASVEALQVPGTHSVTFDSKWTAGVGTTHNSVMVECVKEPETTTTAPPETTTTTTTPPATTVTTAPHDTDHPPVDCNDPAFAGTATCLPMTGGPKTVDYATSGLLFVGAGAATVAGARRRRLVQRGQ